ncbi:ABC transporter permease [Saccharibacillus deserti]|uniref:ABC transporter permease n=1 Tax=Saccharibacillus deserti TaxID=1634444 RepID=UPI001557FE2A|nr:ABC transporter permease [Saccharibacillus deserti]
MSLKKRIILIALALLFTATGFMVLQSYDRDNAVIKVSAEIKSDVKDDYQLFYIASGSDWTEENSFHKNYDSPGVWQKLEYEIPANTKEFRMDLGHRPGKVEMRNFKISAISEKTIALNEEWADSHQLKKQESSIEEAELRSEGEDPYFVIESQPLIKQALTGNDPFHTAKNAVSGLLFGATVAFVFRYARTTLEAAKEIVRHRRLVLNLGKNDFKTKFASSYLGIVWGFITPLITIATYWFVFQVGLRSGDVGELPFILWFLAGIIPWFFFSEAFGGATNALSEYSYLVKKVVFKIELLPTVKIVSALFVHVFFLIVIFVVYAAYGYYPSIYNLQLVYYLLCSIVLALGLSFLTSSIVLFFKDLNQIITIILQIGFWFTPIGWPVTMLSGFWATLFKMNPMFYIVQGFRDSFVDHILFYERPYATLYFWVLCLAILTLGIVTFRKLKPHFSDVL